MKRKISTELLSSLQLKSLDVQLEMKRKISTVLLSSLQLKSLVVQI